VEAAEYLGVLITGPLNNRSLFGAITLDESEVDRVATTGVEVFLRAYRAGG
jgi:AefR-like transcriptional repressor, C-terminal domain